MKAVINDFRGGVCGKTSANLASVSRAEICANINFLGGNLKASGALQSKIAGKTPSEGFYDSLLGSGNTFCGGRAFLFKKFDKDSLTEQVKLVLFDEKFNAYYVNLSGDDSFSLVPLGIKFNARPLGVSYNLNGEDVFIMVSPKDNMVVWKGEGEPEIIIDAPQVTSLALHYERLFVTTTNDPFKLGFSDDLDPTNWSESVNDAGFINMIDERGKLKKVISFNDYLYVFRERGISRVYANTVMQSNFYVNHLFTAGGEIYDKTIAVCGDKICFVATDGIYTFNGSSVLRRLDELFPLIGGLNNARAVYHNGSYYLACHINFSGLNITGDDPNTSNAIIKIDGENFDYVIYHISGLVDIVDLGSGYNLMLLTTNNDCPILELDEAEDGGLDVFACYKTGLVKLNNSRDEQVVRRVSASVCGSCKLSFYNERGEWSSELTLSEKESSKALLFSGEKIGYMVVLDKVGDSVERLTIEVA